MNKKQKDPVQVLISQLFFGGKQFCKEGNFDQAKDYINMCLVKLAELTLEGETVVGKLSIDQWKDRCWNILERYDLMECGDCSDLNLLKTK